MQSLKNIKICIFLQIIRNLFKMINKLFLQHSKLKGKRNGVFLIYLFIYDSFFSSILFNFFTGNSVVGKSGELVIATPTLSMPISVWGDEGDAKMQENYLSKYPGKFSTVIPVVHHIKSHILFVFPSSHKITNNTLNL